MKAGFRVNKYVLYAVVILLSLAILFPIYWLAVTSFKGKTGVYDVPTILPQTFHYQNYTVPFTEGDIGEYLFNSLLIATLNTLLVLILAIPATYALSRFDVYGAKHLFFWMITNRMAPPAVFILPFFLIFSTLKMLDTYAVVILVYCVFNLPFAVWLLKGMIDGIPVALDESAMLDGCNMFGVLWRIIIPLAKPGIAVTGLLCWLFAWNHYIFAVILTSTNARPITTGLAEYVTVMGTNWGRMAAVALVTMLPAFFFVYFAQNYIVTGLTFGAVKQ